MFGRWNNALRWGATLVALVLAVAAFLQSSGSGAAAAPVSQLQKVLERGTVVVGVTSEVAPFGFIDPKTQELVGMDIDIARLVAKALFDDPTKITFKKIAFAARWDEVNSGSVDFGIMVTTIWPDRLSKVNFTTPYIRSGLGILASKSSGVTSLADLNDPKYTIAIQNDAGEIALMADQLPNTKTLILSSEADMLAAVQSGQATGEMIDTPVAAWREANTPSLVNLGTLSGVGSWAMNAMFVGKDDFQWLEYLDGVVEQMRCGGLYGEFAQIYQKWFKVDPPTPAICIAFSQQELLDALK